VADVPVVAFLSGGIDSSAVVAAMQAQSSSRVHTFCIGFQEPAYNEAPYAEAVARHLHTEHTTLVATPEQAREVIPRLPELFDEPFGDSSQIPTFLVSQLARQQVTVSLSGDGGDELFGGYQRYTDLERRWAAVGWLPASCRQWSAALLGTMTGGRLRSLRGLLESSDSASLYLRSHAHWRDPEQLVIGGRVPETLFSRTEEWCLSPRFRERMMFLDTLTYLPDDILVKVDRASMGVGLEARVPLLDHRLVEFVWSLPWKYRVHRGQSKWLLRRVLGRYVPPRLFQRPKVGFGVPIDHWLRGDLRPWAEALLDERRLAREGFFPPRPIREKWQQHLSGRANWQYLLWDVLMFQAWLESQGSTP
jgi:asparagine synthase (glutamine-hydrolysing)